MLFKTFIKACKCEFAVCSFDHGGFGYSFVIWAGGVFLNQLSSMNQQNAWEIDSSTLYALFCSLNEWSLSSSVLLGGSDSEISDVSYHCH